MGGGAGTPEVLAHVYELARTHRLLQMTRGEGGIPSFHSLSRGKSSASCLQSLYDSDPDESPSTVPALMLRATPFSWSGRPRLAEAARLSLEEDP